MIVHSETQTFDRRSAAEAWVKKRERELEAPGAIERAGSPSVTLDGAIGRYIEESARAMGRTKVQVLKSIRTAPIASMRCDRIGSPDILEFLQSLQVTPQTVGNYAAHLGAVFAVARPAWGYPLDPSAIKDALIVAKRLGVVGRSRQRDRRPTMDELDRLFEHFEDRRRRVPQALPMTMVIAFALFSSRRQEEIVSVRWTDYDADAGRVLVRDMKNPGEKVGNNVWVDVPEPARRIIGRMPRRKPQIFPYSAGAIGRNFTEACHLLGIDDLHFHDLRHEAVSRLFEMGLNIPHVAAVSGHRSWGSLKRYTHLRHTGDRYAAWPWIDRLAPEPATKEDAAAPGA